MKRSLLLLVSLFLLLFGFTNTKANEEVVFCTMDYSPVCGEKQVQCFTTPCYPVKETYSNLCMLEASKANYLYEGECSLDKYSNLSNKTKAKLDKVASNFIKKLDTNLEDNNKKNEYLNLAISKLETLREEKPKYNDIISYLIFLFEEEILNYNVILK